MPELKLLDEEEAAGLLQVAPQTLATWRCRGLGPTFVRVGRRLIRYREVDLLAFLESGTVQPNTANARSCQRRTRAVETV